MTSGKKVRWALVGLGDIARKRVGPALLEQPQSELRACVTRNPAAHAEDLATLNPQQVYSFDEMLTDDAIDAVYLGTPVFLHAPQAIAALEAGKHVLVEKPMALTVIDAETMNAVAERSQRHLAVAYYRRFWPSFQFVKQTIDRGGLGQLVLVRLALHSWYQPSGDDTKAWRVRPELSGGGVMSDVGSHRLDLLAWWLGLPSRVIADVRTRTHSYSAEDSVTALLMFADNIPCTASFQWNSKTWTDELHIVGTEAKISFPVFDDEAVQITRGREATVSKFLRPTNSHLPMIDEFVGSILAVRPPRFCGTDGVAATRMMDAITQSARIGAWVEVLP